MSELYSANVDARAYHLFFLLNQETKIRVKTGFGLTYWEEAGDGRAGQRGGCQGERPQPRQKAGQDLQEQQADGQVRRRQAAALRLPSSWTTP